MAEFPMVQVSEALGGPETNKLGVYGWGREILVTGTHGHQIGILFLPLFHKEPQGPLTRIPHS